MAEDQQSKPTPPYLPYKTLLSSLQNLGQGVPPRIDRSIWKNQPGVVQSQILSAYRFFGLIDPTSTEPTPLLRALVEARDTPAPVLRPILEAKYAPILKHDLATMTTTMLNNDFELAFGVDGETKKKGIRFFLQAAKANGMTLSKFLLDQTRASSGTSGRRRKAAGKRDSEIDTGEDDVQTGEEAAPPSGTRRTITLESEGKLSLILSVDLFSLSTEDRTFVFGLIDSLREYEAKHTRRA